MDVKFNQAASAYKNASQMKGGLTTPSLPGEGPDDQKVAFSDLIGKSLETARSKGYESESLSAQSIANKAELSDLVTSVTNAELTLQTVVAVRDRMISAYQDISKMPI